MVKNLPAIAGHAHLTPGSKRSTGGRNGNPLQSSCLENLMNREAWRSTVHRIAKSQTQLSTDAHTCTGTPAERDKHRKGTRFQNSLLRSHPVSGSHCGVNDANNSPSSHLLILPSCLWATSSQTSDYYSCASSIGRCHDRCEVLHHLQMTFSNLGDP